jgi:hypothetical protein
MRLVDCLERSGLPWCAIGGAAVKTLEEEGFRSERFQASVNLRRKSEILMQSKTVPGET